MIGSFRGKLLPLIVFIFSLHVARGQTLLPCGLPAEGNVVSGTVAYTLSADCQMTGQLSVLNDAQVTVNGGGYTITGRDQYDSFFYASDNATLIINNATLDGKGIRRSDIVDVRGTLEMTNVSVRNASNGPPVYLTGSGELENVLFENNDPSAYGKARSASALRLNGGSATITNAVFRDNYGGGGAITIETLGALVGSLTTKGCLLFSGNVPYDAQVQAGSWTKSHTGTCAGKIGNGDDAVIAPPAITACGLPARGNLDFSATYTLSRNCTLASTKAHDPYWDIPEGATIAINGRGRAISGGSGSNSAYIRIADNATLTLENVTLDKVWLLSFGDVNATDTAFTNIATRAILLEGGASLERVIFRNNSTSRQNQATAVWASSYFNDGDATIKDALFAGNSGTHASSPSYPLNTLHTSNSTTSKITLEGCITFRDNTPSDKNYLTTANITDNSSGECGSDQRIGPYLVTSSISESDIAATEIADSRAIAAATATAVARWRMDTPGGCFQHLGSIGVICRPHVEPPIPFFTIWRIDPQSHRHLELRVTQPQVEALRHDGLIAGTSNGRVAVYLAGGDCVVRDERGNNPQVTRVDSEQCVARQLTRLRDAGGGNPLGMDRYIIVAKGPNHEGKTHTVYFDNAVSGRVIGAVDVFTGPPGIVSQPTQSVATLAHVVAAGETLYAIGQKYGVSVDAIAAMNDLSDGGRQIRAGQTLRIPVE